MGINISSCCSCFIRNDSDSGRNVSIRISISISSCSSRWIDNIVCGSCRNSRFVNITTYITRFYVTVNVSITVITIILMNITVKTIVIKIIVIKVIVKIVTIEIVFFY